MLGSVCNDKLHSKVHGSAIMIHPFMQRMEIIESLVSQNGYTTSFPLFPFLQADSCSRFPCLLSKPLIFICLLFYTDCMFSVSSPHHFL